MPTEVNNKRYKELVDMVERLISDFSTSRGGVEIGFIDKEETEEIKRILKESQKSIYYECEIRAVINPTSLTTGYKLIVKRK